MALIDRLSKLIGLRTRARSQPISGAERMKLEHAALRGKG